MKRKLIKTPTLKKSKKDAWDAFSKFIRLRDALKTTKTKTHLLCVTCDKKYPAFHVGCAQAGHLFPGRKNAVLIDERFVNGQCYNCNVNLRGNWVVYEQKMVERYGREEVEQAKFLSRQVVPRNAGEWIEIKEKYEKKYLELDT